MNNSKPNSKPNSNTNSNTNSKPNSNTNSNTNSNPNSNTNSNPNSDDTKNNKVLHYIVPSNNLKDQFIIRDPENGKMDCVVDQEFCIVENVPNIKLIEIRAIFRHCNVYISMMDKESKEVIFLYSFSIRSLPNLLKSSGTYYKKHNIYILNIQTSNYQKDENSNIRDTNTDDCFIIENSKPHLMKTYVRDNDSLDNLKNIRNFIKQRALQIKRVPLVDSNMGSLFMYLSILIRYQRELRFVRFVRLFTKFNPKLNIIDYIDFYSRSTLLHHAASYSSLDLIKFILDNSQSKYILLTLINNFNFTPISVARHFKRPNEIIKLLELKQIP